MTPKGSPKLAVLYSRWSSAPQGEGSTEARQLQLARDWIARNPGYTLDERHFTDEGKSAYRGKNVREGGELHRLVEAIRTGALPRDVTILTESGDRLSRLPPLDALDALRNILALGCSVVTLDNGRTWTKASLGGEDFGGLILSLVNAHRSWSESDMKSKRVSASWDIRRQAVAKGERKLITRQAPAWIRWDEDRKMFALIPDRVRIVRRIFDLLPHMGAQAIARKLNEEHVKPFGTASAWSHPYIRKVSRSVAVLGKLRLPGASGEHVEFYYPAAITPAQWHASRRVEGKPKPPSGPTTFTNLFQGIAVCGLCGSPLHLVSRGVRARKSKPKGWSDPNAHRLECSGRRASSGCQAKGYQLEPLTEFVLSGIYSKLDWQAIAPSMKAQTTAQIEELQEQVATSLFEREQVRQRILRLMSALETGGEDIAPITTRLRELQEKEKALVGEHRDAEERLGIERGKLETVGRDSKKLADTFAEWMVKKAHTPADRQRMTHALRDSIEQIQVSEARVVVKLIRDGQVVLPVELKKIGRAVEMRMRERLKIKV